MPVAPIRAVCDEFCTALTLKCPIALLTGQNIFSLFVIKILTFFLNPRCWVCFFALFFVDIKYPGFLDPLSEIYQVEEKNPTYMQNCPPKVYVVGFSSTESFHQIYPWIWHVGFSLQPSICLPPTCGWKCFGVKRTICRFRFTRFI